MIEQDFEQNITEIAQALSELEKEAYYEYLGPVERLCDNLDSTENDVGLMLDYLLSFCGNSKVLGLYKKVCRTFYNKYPECISDYIVYYLEEYEPEKYEELKRRAGIDKWNSFIWNKRPEG